MIRGQCPQRHPRSAVVGLGISIPHRSATWLDPHRTLRCAPQSLWDPKSGLCSTVQGMYEPENDGRKRGLQQGTPFAVETPQGQEVSGHSWDNRPRGNFHRPALINLGQSWVKSWSNPCLNSWSTHGLNVVKPTSVQVNHRHALLVCCQRTNMRNRCMHGASHAPCMRCCNRRP